MRAHEFVEARVDHEPASATSTQDLDRGVRARAPARRTRVSAGRRRGESFGEAAARILEVECRDVGASAP